MGSRADLRQVCTLWIGHFPVWTESLAARDCTKSPSIPGGGHYTLCELTCNHILYSVWHVKHSHGHCGRCTVCILLYAIKKIMALGYVFYEYVKRYWNSFLCFLLTKCENWSKVISLMRANAETLRFNMNLGLNTIVNCLNQILYMATEWITGCRKFNFF